MAAIDFITALGRVLHNGSLRDSFAADAPAFVRQIELREEDQASFLKLIPADLEFQARTLLRKRFDLVRHRLPKTCGAMGEAAWLEFVRYGRSHAPAGKYPALTDALGFAQYLTEARPDVLCRRELNRCRFALGPRRFALHLVAAQNRRQIPRLQILLRRRSNAWREWLIYLGC